MSEAEDLIQKGLEALSQQNYYDAMSYFTKAYNITGNIRQLIMSSDASFKLALTYLKNNDLNNWDTFSKNALDARANNLRPNKPNRRIPQKNRRN